MSLLVTGSIGIDDLKTPVGQARGVYGGSAVYFSMAARLFTQVRFVGVVGEDFPPDFRAYLERFGFDLAGLEVRKGSKTFKWAGEYDTVTSDARTTGIELNVLAEAGPKIPPAFADSEFLFLAATHPRLQEDMIRQVRSPKLVVADTRDLWINTQRDALLHTLSLVQGAILNDVEAMLFTGEKNLVLAGRRILEWGPRFVVIKKGEHGSMIVTADRVAVLPAYPTTAVKDPTGAGDSFAGGMMGYLTTRPDLGFDTLRNALARGTVAASFTIEDFSMARIEKVTRADLDRRLQEYAGMLHVE
ncbi:MAG TPA: PfkB family carbohydrate kinase [Phycisphaerae bacterium]|nr:PfkB family carbohydrate kinase [Phycisphaerae bacterium]